jgi:ABC-2 type transport system permease protein
MAAANRAASWLRSRLQLFPIVAEMTVKQKFTDSFVIFTVLIQPLLIALMGLWMLKDKGAGYGIYVVVGSGMSGLWSGLLFISASSIVEERWGGTLESLAGMPTSLAAIVFAKNMANVLQALISMAGAYGLAALFFGYPLSIAHPLEFAVSLALTVVGLVCFGMLLAPLFIMSRELQRFTNGLEFPVYILSGFLFPVAMLPSWSVPIGMAFPTFWAARALHLTAEGGAKPGDVPFCWLILAAEGIAYALGSALLFRLVLRKARRDATLDME